MRELEKLLEEHGLTLKPLPPNNSFAKTVLSSPRSMAAWVPPFPKKEFTGLIAQGAVRQPVELAVKIAALLGEKTKRVQHHPPIQGNATGSITTPWSYAVYTIAGQHFTLAMVAHQSLANDEDLPPLPEKKTRGK